MTIVELTLEEDLLEIRCDADGLRVPLTVSSTAVFLIALSRRQNGRFHR
jgi:hypothetical protein